MRLREIRENAIREIAALRQDLQDLKRCQVQYFTLALTGTGAILGLAAILANDFRGLAVLAPLAIILPNWVIFFDKATSITRIVGYQRILETQVCASRQCYRIVGFENALAEFRSKEEEAWKAIGSSIQRSAPPVGVLVLGTRHRFWMISWYSFALLALICCVGSYSLLGEDRVALVLPFGVDLFASERSMWAGSAFILVAGCAAYTAHLVFSLTCGGLSYEACTRKWDYILGLAPRGRGQ